MTDERMAPLEFVEKAVDSDLVRVTLAFTTERMTEVEVEDAAGPPKEVRSPLREMHRNGYREQLRDICAERIVLPIPELRKGIYLLGFLELRRRAWEGLVADPQEDYVHGQPARAVEDLVKAMGADGMSKSQVSRLRAELDERLNALPSQLSKGISFYLWMDATCIISCDDSRRSH